MTLWAQSLKVKPLTVLRLILINVDIIIGDGSGLDYAVVNLVQIFGKNQEMIEKLQRAFSNSEMDLNPRDYVFGL